MMSEIRRYYRPDGAIDLEIETSIADGHTLEIRREFHPNGQLAREAPTKNGIANGIHRRYHQNGKLHTEHIFVNGKVDGVWKEYYPNGQLRLTMSMQMDHQEGRSEYYSSDGKLLGACNIITGRGLKQEWDPDGFLSYVCPVLSWKLHGAEQIRDDDSEHLRIYGYYVRGKKVSKQGFVEAARKDPSLLEGLSADVAKKLIDSKFKKASGPARGNRVLRRESDSGLPLGEVRKFLSQPGTWTLGELSSNQESRRLAEDIYERGAAVVFVEQVTKEIEGGSASGLEIAVRSQKDADSIVELLSEYGVIVDMNESFDSATKTLHVELD